MQFNPSRLVAPSATGSGAVAQFAGLANTQLNELGSLFGERGRDERTDNVTKLIGSGALDKMSESEARNAITQASQGDVGKQMSANIDALLQTKGGEEKAKALFGNQVELQKMRDKSASDRIGEASNQAITRQLLFGDNGGKSRYASAGGGIVYDTTTGKVVESGGSTSPLDKLMAKNIVEQFQEGDFSRKKRESVEGLYDKDNYIFDAEFTEPRDKQVMNQIMFEATDNPIGRKVIASNDPEAVNEYVRQVLESRGQYLDEGLFGSIEIKDRKNKDGFLDKLFN